MNRLQKCLRSLPVIHRYLSDLQYKATLSLAGSFALNLLYAAWELLCGIYYRSFWFVTLGCYSFLLMMIRLILLRGTRGDFETETTEWKRYRTCGVLLLLMNFILSGIIVLAVTESQGSRYAGYLIYAMAFYTFYKVGLAIRDLVKYRDQRQPVFAASKVIRFVSALVSMLSLEIAMNLRFGGDRSFFRTMTISTGTGVCVAVSGMAVHMIVAAQKSLRALTAPPCDPAQKRFRQTPKR